MRRYQKHPRAGQRVELLIQPLMKLYKFHHKSIIRAGNASLLLDKLLSLLVIIPKLEDHKSYDHCDRPRHTLDTMYQHIAFALLVIEDEIYDDVKKTLNVLVL